MAPGSTITVTGIPNNAQGYGEHWEVDRTLIYEYKKNTQNLINCRFYINLRVRRDGDIIFQYNPRIKEGEAATITLTI